MIRFLTLLTIVLLVATSVMIFMTKGDFGVRTEETEKGTGVAQIGGDFTLTNQDGKIVNNNDFRGKVMLVFFGFTNCTDICPVGAATIASTLSQIGEDTSSVAPMFITINPENDTPEVLKKYLAGFDERIIGLTGTKEQIETATNAYKAFASKDGENINHSGFIYLMDKNGVYAKHFSYNADVGEIYNAIKELIK